MTILCGVYNKMETEKAYAWPSKTDQDGEYSFLLTECGNRILELDAAARRIQALCRRGYRYRDFLILARTGEAYYHIAEEIFLFREMNRTSPDIASGIEIGPEGKRITAGIFFAGGVVPLHGIHPEND